MEFLLGGSAALGAGFFTNPLEVVKTRMQLQGELKARGQYAIHYRNVFHAFYNIAKVDGILALQKGLVPALNYQFFMNGCRLGVYQCLINLGMTKDSEGKTSFLRSVGAGAVAGCCGAFVGSPIYMVKTHLQSLSDAKIAVGHQHSYRSLSGGLAHVYRLHGITGLWRGVTAAMSRVMVGSSVQLSTFSTTKEYVIQTGVFKKDSFMNPLAASMLGGVGVVICMTPFDVVSTRLYNQAIDAEGRGLLYSGTRNCFVKIWKSEGMWGFYKGWAASLFRLGPHTVLSLVFWDEIRKFYLSRLNTS